MRRLKVVSKGTPLDTKVYDAITGEEIRGVTKIVIDVDAEKAIATVNMSVVGVELDVEAELDE
jgi:transcription antitermination factor NusG